MHREIDTSETPFQPKTHLRLYLFTAILALFLIADLWPQLASLIPSLPTWPGGGVYGVRFALIAAVLGGARSLFGSLEKLTQGKLSADLAVAVACIAAILIREPLVAAEVVFIGLLGECLEAITFDRTQRALGRLGELFPQRCWVLRDGVEVRTFTKDLLVGDKIAIKPGGKIPADGIVLEGRSAVLAAALTGESLPIDKGPGDSVLAGCLVQDGSLIVEAKRVHQETVAGQALALTERAMKDKSTGERQADKLAKYFLPIVLGLAVIAFLVNIGIQLWLNPSAGPRPSLGLAARLSLYPTLAVLVVACPCPLVLATPAAMIAAFGRLAGTGVWIKSGAALERLAQVKSFAFDKTGTLTEGQLELGTIHPLEGGISPDDLLRLAAAAEAKSEHPMAAAVLKAARAKDLQLPEADGFQAVPGGGIRVLVNGLAVRIGTARFLKDEGITIPESAIQALAELDTTGQSALLVARSGIVLGLLGTRDRIRPEAFGVLTELRDLGLQPLTLLTGDRASVARAVAGELPLTAVHADLLPSQKAELLNGAAFVGDGINDAPALASASVGLAIGTGADLAARAGDIVLMGEPLRQLPLVVKLARETVKVIRQNIVWFGFGVNLVGVVLTGFLWPLIFTSPEWFDKAPLAGVLYHQIGSIAVLLNSMRLLGFERTRSSWIARNFLGFDRWLNTLHFHDLSHWFLERWKRIVGFTLLISLAIWLVTSFTVIRADEVGVCQRFGAVRDDLAPGLHLRWPWPIESVTRIKPAEVKSVEVGFRLLNEDKAKRLQETRAEQNKLRRPSSSSSNTTLTWASSHSEEIAKKTDESLLLTGDGDLVELFATVRFRISDPRAFLFQLKDSEAILRAAAECAFRELTAARGFQNILGSGRTTFEWDAKALLEKRLNESTAGGAGIQIEGIAIHDLHPPQDVVAAYHAVAEAIQKRDKVINEAKAEASRITSRAGDDALKSVRAAEAEAFAKTSEAQAALDAMAAWTKERNTLSTEEEKTAGNDPKKREAIINQKKALTELRLGLAAITSVLRTRDKILIDADKVPGTRKLFLLDPDLFPKSPVPLAFPRGGPSEQRDPP